MDAYDIFIRGCLSELEKCADDEYYNHAGRSGDAQQRESFKRLGRYVGGGLTSLNERRKGRGIFNPIRSIKTRMGAASGHALGALAHDATHVARGIRQAAE